MHLEETFKSSCRNTKHTALHNKMKGFTESITKNITSTIEMQKSVDTSDNTAGLDAPLP